jgi:hypothetical protein
LPNGLVEQTLAAARAIDEEGKVPTALAPHLPDAERLALLGRALDDVIRVGDE